MFDFFALFFIAIAAIIGVACAISYFWRVGPWWALGGGAFTVCVFLIFWASGMWEGASRHSWGILTPIFFLIIAVAGGIVAVLGVSARIYFRSRQRRPQKPRWEKR